MLVFATSGAKNASKNEKRYLRHPSMKERISKMKRMLAILLTIVLSIISIAVSACAENEITLPAGLEFGMDYAEATAVSHYSPQNASESKKMEGYVNARGFSSYDYLVGEATIGGLEAEVYVFFDENGLKQIEYLLYDEKLSDSNAEKESAKEIFNIVESGLTTTYGEPVSEEEGIHQYTQPIIFNCDYDSAPNHTSRQILKSFGDTVRIVKLANGGSVYINNLCGVENFLTSSGRVTNIVGRYSSAYSRLMYTYYDFQIDSSGNSSSVGF